MVITIKDNGSVDDLDGDSNGNSDGNSQVDSIGNLTGDQGGLWIIAIKYKWLS